MCVCVWIWICFVAVPSSRPRHGCSLLILAMQLRSVEQPDIVLPIPNATTTTLGRCNPNLQITSLRVSREHVSLRAEAALVTFRALKKPVYLLRQGMETAEVINADRREVKVSHQKIE